MEHYFGDSKDANSSFFKKKKNKYATGYGKNKNSFQDYDKSFPTLNLQYLLIYIYI